MFRMVILSYSASSFVLKFVMKSMQYTSPRLKINYKDNKIMVASDNMTIFKTKAVWCLNAEYIPYLVDMKTKSQCNRPILSNVRNMILHKSILGSKSKWRKHKLFLVITKISKDVVIT